MTEAATSRTVDPSLLSWTHWMYALHALSAAIGVFGAPFIITAFAFGWPSIIAVIMNYVKRGEAGGTYLESHFTWQLRTFWFAVLWLLVFGSLGFLFAITIIGLPIAILFFLALLAVGVWAVYRIVRGWLRLRDHQPIVA